MEEGKLDHISNVNAQDFNVWNDYDEDEEKLCQCGTEIYWVDCWSCGGEGGTDGEDLMMEDPLWYMPDDFRVCDVCEGEGGWFNCLNSECNEDDEDE
jgi:hypothetical protein